MKRDLIYFNTPANGLLDSSSEKELEEYFDMQKVDPGSYFVNWMQENKPYIKEKFAKILNCLSSEIALVPNSSYAISSFCISLPSKFKVMMLDQEYPSLFEPFRLQGFEMFNYSSSNGYDWDYEAIKAKLIEDKIDVLTVSHVQYLSGYRVDLKELGRFCSESGILFIVDATQSLGALPVDVNKMHIDVLVASSYKWLNAGPGSAVLVLRQNILEKYPPRIGGFGSYVPTESGFVYQASISSYEPGHVAISSLVVLEGVLNSRIAADVEQIEEHNLSLAQYFRAKLEDRNVFALGLGSNPNYQSPIVSVDWDEIMWKKLTDLDIACSFRGGRIRFGFHFHNSKTEIDELFRRIDQSATRTPFLKAT
jgi:cysteine desulfurase / selenocysteine lyase